MSHVIKHDTIHLIILSTHANLHETNLPVYITTIAVINIYTFDCDAKKVVLLLIIFIYDIALFSKTT